MLTPKPFQEDNIQRFLDEGSYAGLDASVVGVGKTLTAVEVNRRLGAKRTLIIAPPNTEDGWERHFRLQMDEPVRRASGKNAATKQAFVDLTNGVDGTYFMGWEFARGMAFDKLNLDMLIADEVHRAQNRKAKSAGMYHSLAVSTLKREGRVLALSGTPAGNEAPGLWSVIHGLWPERYPYFTPWVKRWCTEVWNSYAGIPEWHNEKIPGQAVAHLPLYWRHEQGVPCCIYHPRGVQEDLPKRVVHDVLVDLSAGQKKLYREMDSRMMAWVDDHEWPITAKGLPMLEHARLLQISLAEPNPEMEMRMKTSIDKFTGEKTKSLENHHFISYPLDCKSSKIDAMLDILKDIPAGERVVVFTHSSAIIPALVHRINSMTGHPHNAVPWNGDVSAVVRAEYKWQFMNDGPASIIVAQVAALAEGVDGLQTVCANEIWFSPSANGMENTQALGRLVRNGQTRAVNSWNIIARGTIEQEKTERLDVKAHRMVASLHA